MVIRALGKHIQTADEIELIFKMRKRLSARMRAFRLSNGINNKEADGLLSLGNGGNSTWRNIEYNKTISPNMETVSKIAIIMGIDLPELLAPLPEELEYK